MRKPDQEICLIDGATIWKLHGTHGFNVDISLELVWEEHSMLPIWTRLIEAAQEDGTNIGYFIERLIFLSSNIYEEPYRAKVIEGLILLKAKYEKIY